MLAFCMNLLWFAVVFGTTAASPNDEQVCVSLPRGPPGPEGPKGDPGDVAECSCNEAVLTEALHSQKRKLFVVHLYDAIFVSSRSKGRRRDHLKTKGGGFIRLSTGSITNVILSAGSVSTNGTSINHNAGRFLNLIKFCETVL